MLGSNFFPLLAVTLEFQDAHWRKNFMGAGKKIMLFFLFPAGSCDQTIKVTAASREPKEQHIFFASARAIFPPARWHCSEKKIKGFTAPAVKCTFHWGSETPRADLMIRPSCEGRTIEQCTHFGYKGRSRPSYFLHFFPESRGDHASQAWSLLASAPGLLSCSKR